MQEDLKSVAEPSHSAGARESNRDSSVRPPHGQGAVGTRPSDTGKAAHSGEERDMHLPRGRGIAKMAMRSRLAGFISLFQSVLADLGRRGGPIQFTRARLAGVPAEDANALA